MLPAANDLQRDCSTSLPKGGDPLLQKVASLTCPQEVFSEGGLNEGALGEAQRWGGLSPKKGFTTGASAKRRWRSETYEGSLKERPL